MVPYANRNGDSNVVAYEIGETWIRVQFSTESPYTYSYHKAGRIHVENMKKLALSGSGLNGYINLNCRKLYD